MDDFFQTDEKLYRAVLPYEMFIRSDGTLTDAAFRDKKGLSVDRGNNRPDEEAVAFMKNCGRKGKVFRFLVSDCQEKQILVQYKPTEENPYHSEVHGGEDKIILSGGQRRHLAAVAVEVGKAG